MNGLNKGVNMADTAKIKDFGTKIQKLIKGENLSRDETYGMFREVLLNEQPDLQQGAFLAALVAKGETVDEIAGAWAAIDEIDTIHSAPDLPDSLFENSGTGMDALKTFNVSSAAAIVAAACGINMVRHGARAITSLCGTVDILEAVGIDVECDVSIVENSLRQAGIGLFNGMSPKVHPGALGRILSQIRFGSTLNIAASLANPCRPTYGLRGVYTEKLVRKAALVMQSIGYEKGMVVYGKDAKSGYGMDELSLSGGTVVHEFTRNGCNEYTLLPEDAGLKQTPFEEMAAIGDPATEAVRFIQVLSGKKHKACIDFTCLNAGAILYTAGKCDSIRKGVEMGRASIESNHAIEKLRQWTACQDSSGGKGLQRFESLLEKAAAL
ncbi:MAG: anthranilate phosphoribosyltransferase [Deltaproteobacteria bacterium]|nr:anthranilate phosphoribosyltransferase [Deltaproteobacteria bacterium]